VDVRRAVLRFATDADSVGRVVCANAEELGAAMVVIPSHGKGASDDQCCRALHAAHMLHRLHSSVRSPSLRKLTNNLCFGCAAPAPGRLREMFLGSTSNYCTHHCKAPVLVLR
jgi:nucleotide-binding universal stress UspA family protein